jgi:hypothetical protein
VTAHDIRLVEGRRTRDPFVRFDREACNDERLSFKARGLLAWLLDKKEGWITSVERVAQASPDGAYAVRSALKELEALGYLDRSRARGDGGKWVAEWTVHDAPDHERKPRMVQRENRARKPRTTPPITETENKTDKTLAAAAAGELPGMPAPRAKREPIINALADAIARDEWERRDRKPVCGFPAFRARITECLDAGATEEQLLKVLPTMTVFSRNAFDFALGGSGKRQAKRAVDDSGQRAGPAGRVQL